MKVADQKKRLRDGRNSLVEGEMEKKVIQLTRVVQLLHSTLREQQCYITAIQKQIAPNVVAKEARIAFDARVNACDAGRGRFLSRGLIAIRRQVKTLRRFGALLRTDARAVHDSFCIATSMVKALLQQIQDSQRDIAALQLVVVAKLKTMRERIECSEAKAMFIVRGLLERCASTADDLHNERSRVVLLNHLYVRAALMCSRLLGSVLTCSSMHVDDSTQIERRSAGLQNATALMVRNKVDVQISGALVHAYVSTRFHEALKECEQNAALQSTLSMLRGLNRARDAANGLYKKIVDSYLPAMEKSMVSISYLPEQIIASSSRQRLQIVRPFLNDMIPSIGHLMERMKSATASADELLDTAHASIWRGAKQILVSEVNCMRLRVQARHQLAALCAIRVAGAARRRRNIEDIRQIHVVATQTKSRFWTMKSSVSGELKKVAAMHGAISFAIASKVACFVSKKDRDIEYLTQRLVEEAAAFQKERNDAAVCHRGIEEKMTAAYVKGMRRTRLSLNVRHAANLLKEERKSLGFVKCLAEAQILAFERIIASAMRLCVELHSREVQSARKRRTDNWQTVLGDHLLLNRQRLVERRQRFQATQREVAAKLAARPIVPPQRYQPVGCTGVDVYIVQVLTLMAVLSTVLSPAAGVTFSPALPTFRSSSITPTRIFCQYCCQMCSESFSLARDDVSKKLARELWSHLFVRTLVRNEAGHIMNKSSVLLGTVKTMNDKVERLLCLTQRIVKNIRSSHTEKVLQMRDHIVQGLRATSKAIIPDSLSPTAVRQPSAFATKTGDNSMPRWFMKSQHAASAISFLPVTIERLIVAMQSLNAQLQINDTMQSIVLLYGVRLDIGKRASATLSTIASLRRHLDELRRTVIGHGHKYKDYVEQCRHIMVAAIWQRLTDLRRDSVVTMFERSMLARHIDNSGTQVKCLAEASVDALRRNHKLVTEMTCKLHQDMQVAYNAQQRVQLSSARNLRVMKESCVLRMEVANGWLRMKRTRDTINAHRTLITGEVRTEYAARMASLHVQREKAKAKAELDRVKQKSMQGSKRSKRRADEALMAKNAEIERLQLELETTRAQLFSSHADCRRLRLELSNRDAVYGKMFKGNHKVL